MNLAPTSTGSATAIALIFPELKGKLNGLAIRVPLTNASITDCVFEVKRKTDEAEVNALLKVRRWNRTAGLRFSPVVTPLRLLAGRTFVRAGSLVCVSCFSTARVDSDYKTLRHQSGRIPPFCSTTLHNPTAVLYRSQEASETYLKGILGFETMPLVSTDYVDDARSSIVDAPSTQVIDGTMVKIYAW